MITMLKRADSLSYQQLHKTNGFLVGSFSYWKPSRQKESVRDLLFEGKKIFWNCKGGGEYKRRIVREPKISNSLNSISDIHTSRVKCAW